MVFGTMGKTNLFKEYLSQRQRVRSKIASEKNTVLDMRLRVFSKCLYFLFLTRAVQLMPR